MDRIWQSTLQLHILLKLLYFDVTSRIVAGIQGWEPCLLSDPDSCYWYQSPICNHFPFPNRFLIVLAFTQQILWQFWNIRYMTYIHVSSPPLRSTFDALLETYMVKLNEFKWKFYLIHYNHLFHWINLMN